MHDPQTLVREARKLMNYYTAVETGGLECLRHENARCYFEEETGTLYIFGTDDVQDMAHLLEAGGEAFYGGKFYAGFADHGRLVEKAIGAAGIRMSQIRRVVAHSLGAVAAMWLVALYQIECIAIAPPHCLLDQPVLAVWSEGLTVVRNRADPTDKLPPWADHPRGETVHHVLVGPKWWWWALTSVLTFRFKRLKQKHRMADYVRHLEELRDRLTPAPE